MNIWLEIQQFNIDYPAIWSIWNSEEQTSPKSNRESRCPCLELPPVAISKRLVHTVTVSWCFLVICDFLVFNSKPFMKSCILRCSLFLQTRSTYSNKRWTFLDFWTRPWPDHFSIVISFWQLSVSKSHLASQKYGMPWCFSLFPSRLSFSFSFPQNAPQIFKYSDSISIVSEQPNAYASD